MLIPYRLVAIEILLIFDQHYFCSSKMSTAWYLVKPRKTMAVIRRDKYFIVPYHFALAMPMLLLACSN